MFVLPDLLLMNYSACISQGSMSVCTNKRQWVLEIGVNSPCVSAWSRIDLVLSEVQARHEPYTTDCHMLVVMIYLERWSQKPQERRKGDIKRKKKPSKSLPTNLKRSRIWPEAPQERWCGQHCSNAVAWVDCLIAPAKQTHIESQTGLGGKVH